LKIPLLGSLGLSGNTGLLLAAAGVAALYLLHRQSLVEASSPPTMVVKPSPIGPKDIYSNVLDVDNIGEDFGVTEDIPLQKIGFTVPFSTATEYGTGTRAVRKDYPAARLLYENAYEVGHPSTAGLPFLIDKTTGKRVANSDNAFKARAFETSTTTTTTPTPTTTDPKITDMQNRILRMIVSRTSNVSTVLSNIETIKAEILTYTAKLQLAQQQVDAHVISPLQLSQYLTQIAEDIATKLQIQLNPAYGDNSVPDYYQQYYQNYQNYLNQLNANYYDYYQPSYQYYPGQQYDYYQPYQYQYPNPYMSSGQYPTNYPYYQYNQYPSSSSYGYGYGYGYPSSSSYGYGYGGGGYPQYAQSGSMISIGGPGGINIG
jgi:hypothetical protein